MLQFSRDFVKATNNSQLKKTINATPKNFTTTFIDPLKISKTQHTERKSTKHQEYTCNEEIVSTNYAALTNFWSIYQSKLHYLKTVAYLPPENKNYELQGTHPPLDVRVGTYHAGIGLLLYAAVPL